MKTIKHEEFGGERPLFGSSDIILEDCIIHPGESALKNCRNVEARHCVFEGKYPFWHVDGFRISRCLFTEGARAALWYSSGCDMEDSMIEAPKMFRELDGVKLRRVHIPNAQETLWYCRNVDIEDVDVDHADYLFTHSRDIRIRSWRQQGNYSFQYCENVEIEDADIHSKDALWNTRNVTVRNSRLDGEYLGWYSEGLHLINCHICGTQPLCYCRGLILENCTFGPDADLAFEESEVRAGIRGSVVSIKNPTSGKITVDSVGEIIIDEYRKAPADCIIEVRDDKV